MGFCLGGTFAAIYAAIADEPVKNLVLSVAPVDFSIVPVFDKWADELRNGEGSLETTFDAWGLIPAFAIKSGMRLFTSPSITLHIYRFWPGPTMKHMRPAGSDLTIGPMAIFHLQGLH